MTTERDPRTRIVLSWLREDAHESAERMLLRALDEVDATPQRRPSWPPQRIPELNTVRVLIAAAAIVVVAVVGPRLVPSSGDPGSPTHSPSPSPSAAQTAGAGLPIFPVLPGHPKPVAAGTYTLDSSFPVFTSFVVPPGWLTCVNNAGLLCPADGWGGVEIYIVTNVVVDPCDDAALRDPSVGPTVEDLVIAISSLPWSAVTPPTEITVDGFRGTELEVTAPTSSPCVGTDEFEMWATTLSALAKGVGPGERTRLRILDVHGTRVVIAGSYLPGTTSAQHLAEINAIIDSVRFRP